MTQPIIEISGANARRRSTPTTRGSTRAASSRPTEESPVVTTKKRRRSAHATDQAAARPRTMPRARGRPMEAEEVEERPEDYEPDSDEQREAERQMEAARRDRQTEMLLALASEHSGLMKDILMCLRLYFGAPSRGDLRYSGERARMPMVGQLCDMVDEQTSMLAKILHAVTYGFGEVLSVIRDGGQPHPGGGYNSDSSSQDDPHPRPRRDSSPMGAWEPESQNLVMMVPKNTGLRGGQANGNSTSAATDALSHAVSDSTQIRDKQEITEQHAPLHKRELDLDAETEPARESTPQAIPLDQLECMVKVLKEKVEQEQETRPISIAPLNSTRRSLAAIKAGTA